MNLFDLLHRKNSNSANCLDTETQAIRTKSNGVISGIVFITVIYFLCKYKHEKIAWAVVLVPVVMAIVLFLTIIYKIRSLTMNDLNTAEIQAGI